MRESSATAEVLTHVKLLLHPGRDPGLQCGGPQGAQQLLAHSVVKHSLVAPAAAAASAAAAIVRASAACSALRCLLCDTWMHHAAVVVVAACQLLLRVLVAISGR